MSQNILISEVMNSKGQQSHSKYLDNKRKCTYDCLGYILVASVEWCYRSQRRVWMAQTAWFWSHPYPVQWYAMIEWPSQHLLKALSSTWKHTKYQRLQTCFTTLGKKLLTAANKWVTRMCVKNHDVVLYSYGQGSMSISVFWPKLLNSVFLFFYLNPNAHGHTILQSKVPIFELRPQIFSKINLRAHGWTL